MRVAAVGGLGRARTQDAGVGATLALLLVAVLLVYPLAIGAFDRPVLARDVIAAALAHTSCAVFGVALGRLAAPPVTERAATALLLVLGATIASAALVDPLGIAAGPGKVADALAAAAPGAIPAVLVAAAAATRHPRRRARAHRPGTRAARRLKR